MANDLDLESLERGDIDLSGCDFTGADVSHRILRGRNFNGAKFQGANMSNTDFSGSEMVTTQLFSIDANNAIFDGCKIQAAILSADFTNTSCITTAFHNSNIQGTKFHGCNLTGASFVGASIDDATSFDGAIYDESTAFDSATVSRATARGDIFRYYEFSNGRLQRKAGEPPLSEKPVERLVLETSKIQTASIIRSLNDKPTEIAEMAASLASLLKAEIANLEANKPNEPERLTQYDDFLDLLRTLAFELDKLHSAIDAAKTSAAPLPEKYTPASVVVASARGILSTWLNEKGSSIVDSGFRVGLLGASTAFLGLCGAPDAAAFYIASALVGGERVIDVVKAVVSGKG
jgi:uncharacterized protein YjbI with pentapeptide repeats